MAREVLGIAGSVCVSERAARTSAMPSSGARSEEWEVCPCGWRPELGKHYAKAGHVQWWREQIKERGSLEAVYRHVRKRQREYGDRDMG